MDGNTVGAAAAATQPPVREWQSLIDCAASFRPAIDVITSGSTGVSFVGGDAVERTPPCCGK